LLLPEAWLPSDSNAITVMDLDGGLMASLSADDRPTYPDSKPKP